MPLVDIDTTITLGEDFDSVLSSSACNLEMAGVLSKQKSPVVLQSTASFTRKTIPMALPKRIQYETGKNKLPVAFQP